MSVSSLAYKLISSVVMIEIPRAKLSKNGTIASAKISFIRLENYIIHLKGIEVLPVTLIPLSLQMKLKGIRIKRAVIFLISAGSTGMHSLSMIC